MSDAPDQRTLGGSFRLEGTGLHSGKSVALEMDSAPPDTGVRFRRMDREGEPVVTASVAHISGVEWETSLADGDARVRTMEHVLAALAAARVDNAEIRLEGPEPPAADGSAARWCQAIEEMGVEPQGTPARVLAVEDAFTVTEGDSRYTVSPYPRYRISAEIEFAHPSIGRQFATAEVYDGNFCRQVGQARTFGLESWRDELHSRGLALGASHENTVVLSEDGIAGDRELRYEDEFVRHKLLDVVGDLALVGTRLQAHVMAERPSHRGNVAVARELDRRLRRQERGGGPALDINEILEYIPHRYPMLLVDRVLDFEAGKRIVGLKNVTMNEPFFQGHYPDHPIMPGVLIIEAMAQVGGLLLMNEFDDPEEKVVYFMSLDDVKWRRPVRPGDQIVFELEMIQFRGTICRMKGVGRVDGQSVAEATMMARVMDR